MPFTLKIVLLALVQGLTEFFPVSSSGHLLVFQKLLNFTTLPLVFDIFFHLGTLLAVVVYFFKDLKPLALRFYEKENFRLLLLLATASLPTAVIGFVFKDFFEKLFEKPTYLGLLLFVHRARAPGLEIPASEKDRHIPGRVHDRHRPGVGHHPRSFPLRHDHRRGPDPWPGLRIFFPLFLPVVHTGRTGRCAPGVGQAVLGREGIGRGCCWPSWFPRCSATWPWGY